VPAVHGRPEPVLSSRSLGERLAGTAAERPQRPALTSARATLSFGEVASAADRLATALQVSPGERVAVVAPNVPALVVGIFAAWRAGAVAMPMSARLRHFELERAFADGSPSAAVSLASHSGFAIAREVQALAQSTPTLRAAIVVDQLGEVLGATRWTPREQTTPSPAELAAILYTSGTTGEPKGGLVSHALAEATADNLSQLLGEHAEAPYGLVVPASHAFGFGCLLAGITAGGAAVLVDAATSLAPLVQALREHQATVLHGSPALFGRLLRSGAEISIRRGLVAGSLCPPEVLEALDRRQAQVLNLYGMTEIGSACSCRPEDPAQTRYRTVGRPLGGYELRVHEGEIQVRSSYLLGGYHGRPWAGEELAGDGWFRTGDLGWLDGAGNLVIAGRAKEVVHVGGFNVFPGEVESFLLTHPQVAQAAAVGVAHPVLGEAIEAFVVPDGEAALQPRELVRFARAGIAGYKVPYAVHIVDELPLLPSGKPDRRALARRAELQEVPR
jgi:long-chain acyl-CoA synthetase